MEIYAKKCGFGTIIVSYRRILPVNMYKKVYTFHSKITILSIVNALF